MSTITLENIDINFESVRDKLSTYLQTQDSWKSTLTSSTGSVLLDILGYLGASDKFAIESALREAFPDTARSSKSVLAIARSFWGNHILRKIPASIDVSLSSSLSYALTIPKYSQFSIATLDFFNRSPITIPGNSSVTASLFQGSVRTDTRSFFGSKNEKVYLGSSEAGFNISDEDIYCTVDATGEEYVKTTTSIFETGPNSVAIFFENTLPTGEVEVAFGDGLYGKLPSNTDTLTFTYVETLGASSNQVVGTSEEVSYSGSTSITGSTISSSSGGQNEKDAEYYRSFGPALRSSAVRGGGTTRNDYRAIGLQFPSIVDCIFLGQAETYPNDKSYMNVLTAVLLANPVLSSGDFQEFVTFMQSRTIDGLEFIQQNATPIESNIVMDIYCMPKADPNTVRSKVVTALSNITPLKAGMLGYSYYRSDLITLAEDAGGADLVDYVILTTPSSDLIAQKYEYVKFNSITVNTFYSLRNSTNA